MQPSSLRALGPESDGFVLVFSIGNRTSRYERAPDLQPRSILSASANNPAILAKANELAQAICSDLTTKNGNCTFSNVF